jgi:hypothetical protein
MNVFELASQFRQLEALVEGDLDPTAEDALLHYWQNVEGDLNTKMENLGFAIRNREAILAGKQQAIKDMQDGAASVEKEIDRLKKLAIALLTATNQKKAGGKALTLSVVANKDAVVVDEGATLPPEYMRMPEPKPPVPAPDKTKLYEDMKAGVIVQGARLVPSVRLAIK